MKAKATWVVTGPEPHLATCTRCGRTLPKPPFPQEIGPLVGYMQGFVKQHAGCKQ